MASPVDDSASGPSGKVIAGGRYVSTDPMVWSSVPSITFASGVASSVPVAEYLPNGGSAGEILMSFAGTLPTGVTFNAQTRSFDYSGVGTGSGSGGLTAKTIPLFATIAFKPTAATYPISDQNGNPAQTSYPFSFNHLFNDGQVLPGSSVYCLSVKNGLFGDYNDVHELPESFRCSPIDYYASGCLKNCTLSGVLMAVWKSDGLVCSNTLDLIAVAESVTYGAAPSAPEAGIATVIYESSGSSVSSYSNAFTVQVL